MVEKCIRCGVEGDDVRLFDAIYEGRMERICERCAVIENVPLIRKPDSLQLKESEQAVGVYDRMKRLSGVVGSSRDEVFSREDKIRELDDKPELELPEKEKLNLVENFHWHIMKSRRHKRLTQEQLAKELGESELVIRMLENGKLPENAESLIRKIEQFFQFRLRKVSEMEKIMKERAERPVLLDEDGKELEVIPEPEIEVVEEVEDDLEIDDGKEISDVDIKGMNPSAVTIADLRNLHRKKIEVSRQEQIEEQKRVEERQRLIEAKKEELRLAKDKETDELDGLLGGSELLGGVGKVGGGVEKVGGSGLGGESKGVKKEDTDIEIDDDELI